MANVIKHKRGSGSDPSASDLVVGEVAIRTDVGKLFTKTDSGTVSEIAGGGSDIVLNTLSSSSGTGGGSATFNGSAYRFTLSQPPSVSAYQLLVSINGIIQKPVAGSTSQPSEGFAVDGNDIILGDAPATGADYFILTFKSLGVSEPADNSVTSAKIANGAIVNADINASAAIAGTKISPDFGSQNITTTGSLSTGQHVTLTGQNPHITFTDTNHNPDYEIYGSAGNFKIWSSTAQQSRLTVNSDGHIDIAGNVDFGDGIDVTGAITGTGDLTIDTNTLHVDSSNNRVGIGTSSPEQELHVVGDADACVRLTCTDGGVASFQLGDASDTVIGGLTLNAADNSVQLRGNNNSTRLYIASGGSIGIGTTSPNVLGNDNMHTILSIIETSGTRRGQIELGDNQNVDGGGIGDIHFVGHYQDSGHRDMACVKANASGSTSGKRGAYLSFETKTDNVAAIAERMRIDSSGHVGIGLTPADSFNFGKAVDIGSTSGAFYYARDTDAGSDAVGGIGYSGSGLFIGNEKSDGFIRFSTNTSATERMRIDSSGRVLIGRTSVSQSYVFQVQADSSANAVAIYGRSSDDISELGFYENDGSTKLGELQYRQDHLNFRHRVGYMKFSTADSGSMREVASLGSKGHFAAKGNAGSFVSGTSTPTDITYHQFANTGNGQWCMQLKQEHHNGMNTQLLVASTTNIEAFQIYATSNNSTRFRVLNNGNCGNANNSFGSLSDIKLKENIVDASSQWDDVKAVKVRNFNFKDDKDAKLLGVVAQEIETVSAGLVYDTIDRDPNDSTKEIGTTKNVKYSILYMKAFKALQEAMAKIEVLETKVAALEAK